MQYTLAQLSWQQNLALMEKLARSFGCRYRRILLIRGQRVMMDYDLAALYGVTTARLNEQLRCNAARFPEDFMFQLGKLKFAALMSQIATSNAGRGGRRELPYSPDTQATQTVLDQAEVLSQEWAAA